MEGDLSGEEMIWHFGELAAIATVADIVELTGENRLIVQRGLECISLGEQIGVKALIEAAGMDEHKIDSTALAFGVAPRINAAAGSDRPILRWSCCSVTAVPGGRAGAPAQRAEQSA